MNKITDPECVFQEGDLIVYRLTANQLPIFLVGEQDGGGTITLHLENKVAGKVDKTVIETDREYAKKHYGEGNYKIVVSECPDLNIFKTGILPTNKLVVEHQSKNLVFRGLFRNQP